MTPTDVQTSMQLSISVYFRGDFNELIGWLQFAANQT